MGAKIPQTNDVLIRRLQRVAKWLASDESLPSFASPYQRAANNARANTCWQAAARLEELEAELSKGNQS